MTPNICSVCVVVTVSQKPFEQLMASATADADCCAVYINSLEQQCHNETDLRLRSKETSCLTSHFISVLLHSEALKHPLLLSIIALLQSFSLLCNTIQSKGHYDIRQPQCRDRTYRDKAHTPSEISVHAWLKKTTQKKHTSQNLKNQKIVLNIISLSFPLRFELFVFLTFYN